MANCVEKKSRFVDAGLVDAGLVVWSDEQITYFLFRSGLNNLLRVSNIHTKDLWLQMDGIETKWFFPKYH